MVALDDMIKTIFKSNYETVLTIPSILSALIPPIVYYIATYSGIGFATDFISQEAVFWFSSTVIQGLLSVISILLIFAVYKMQEFRDKKLRGVEEIEKLKEGKEYLSEAKSSKQLIQAAEDWLSESNESSDDKSKIQRNLKYIQFSSDAYSHIILVTKPATIYTFVVVAYNLLLLFIAEYVSQNYQILMIINFGLVLSVLSALYSTFIDILQTDVPDQYWVSRNPNLL